MSVRFLPQVISSRVNELCRIVGKISYEPVHIEAVESRGKGEKPEVESVDHPLERQDVILVQSVRGRLASW